MLSLCAGSGSMLEAAMQLGRSCIAVYYLAIQFAGASKRMSETYDAIIKHVSETHSGDFIGYVMILYAH